MGKIAAAAKNAKQWSAATTALREVRGCLELLGRLRGDLQTGPTVNVGVAISQGAQPRTSEDLDVAIAQHVAQATNGFDPAEIARLKALSETVVINASAGHRSPQLIDSEGNRL